MTIQVVFSRQISLIMLSIQSQFRLSQFILFMIHLYQRISFCFSAQQKYVLKNFKYLIQAPPKKPACGFSLFLKEKTQGKTGVSPAKLMTELGSNWKNLKPQEKVQYYNKAKPQMEAFTEIKASYDNKYVLPFKKSSSTGLFVQHLYKDKVIQLKQKTPIQEYSKEMSKHVKAKTPEQAAKYSEMAKQLNNQKQKKLSAFAFPQKIYKSQSAFTRNHPNIREQDKLKEYKAYQEKWKLDVKKWLEDNKVNLTIEEFLRLYNRNLNKSRKLARAKSQSNQPTESGQSEEAKPKKTVAKRATKTKKPKRVRKVAEKTSK